MDATGDTKIMWSPDNPTEVAIAKKAFDEAKANGFLTYSVNKKGKEGEIVHKFDKMAGRIIMVPGMQGG
jgi:hypothetical protein